MTKKEYMNYFLEKVKDIREPARGFLILLRYNVFDPQQLDELFEIFKGVVNSASDDLNKRKLQKAIAQVEKIRGQGSVSAADMDQSLDSILSEV